MPQPLLYLVYFRFIRYRRRVVLLKYPLNNCSTIFPLYVLEFFEVCNCILLRALAFLCLRRCRDYNLTPLTV